MALIPGSKKSDWSKFHGWFPGSRVSVITPTQPVVGENVFSHESGIHSHGVIKNSATFEPGIMTPEMVGHRRRLNLGKHVGRHAVYQMLADVHIEPSDAQLDVIVEKVKAIGGKGKRVTDADLYEIAETMMGIELNHNMFELVDIAIMTGNHVIPTASVKATVVTFVTLEEFFNFFFCLKTYAQISLSTSLI